MKLIKTGGTNANINKDFQQYRKGNMPNSPIGRGSMPAPTTKKGQPGATRHIGGSR